MTVVMLAKFVVTLILMVPVSHVRIVDSMDSLVSRIEGRNHVKPLRKPPKTKSQAGTSNEEQERQAIARATFFRTFANPV